MPSINEILLKLESFQYSMPLYLNMVYYRIWITKGANNLCTIIIPWEKYH